MTEAEKEKMSIQELERLLNEKLAEERQDTLERIAQIQKRIAPFRGEVKRIRVSNGRDWYPKPVATTQK